MAFDPNTNRVLVANNADGPAFGTLIDATTGKAVVVGPGNNTKIIVPQGGIGGGLEASDFNPVTKTFFLAVPQINNGAGPQGGVAEIDPKSGLVTRVIDLKAIGACPTGCSPTGLAAAKNGQILIGDGNSTPGTAGAMIIDPTGVGPAKVIATFPNINGIDQVWYDPTTNKWFLAAGNNNLNSPGGNKPELVIIDAATDLITQIINTTRVTTPYQLTPSPGRSRSVRRECSQYCLPQWVHRRFCANDVGCSRAVNLGDDAVGLRRSRVCVSDQTSRVGRGLVLYSQSAWAPAVPPSGAAGANSLGSGAFGAELSREGLDRDEKPTDRSSFVEPWPPPPVPRRNNCRRSDRHAEQLLTDSWEMTAGDRSTISNVNVEAGLPSAGVNMSGQVNALIDHLSFNQASFVPNTFGSADDTILITSTSQPAATYRLAVAVSPVQVAARVINDDTITSYVHVSEAQDLTHLWDYFEVWLKTQ